MILEIKVLSGTRKGESLTLLSDESDNNDVPFILETEAIEFNLITDKVFDSVNLLIEDYSIRLNPKFTAENKLKGYLASPSFKDGRLESLFYNYFGLAIIHLETEIDGRFNISQLGKIDVLARKASVEQVESMIQFIVSVGEEELLRARGVTRKGAELDPLGTETPTKLIEQLEKSLIELEKILPYIVHSPISTLANRLSSVRVSPNLDIQEQGISWLLENLSVLHENDDSDSTIFSWNGRRLTANSIQAPVMFENSDIYENRIILGYVDNLLSFVSELIKGLTISPVSYELNNYDGYVSFFSSVAAKLLAKNSSQINRVRSIQSRLRLVRHTLVSRLGITKSDITLPKFTPKVRSNRYYSSIFRLIHLWHQSSRINWRSHKLLLAINNIPKLFELYTVLITYKWLSEVGEESLERNYRPFWQGKLDQLEIKLWYEPTYWMPGHINHEGTLFNTQNKTLANTLADSPGKVRFGKYSNRRPDLVLEINDSSNQTNLIILDSKYTTSKLAYERYLPECIVKYVHGIGSINNSQIVKGMFILYPSRQGNNSSFLDFHSYPFNIHEKTRQIPMLGAQGLPLGIENDNHIKKIGDLLGASLKAFNLESAAPN